VGQEDKIIFESGIKNPSECFFPPTIVENPDENSNLMTEEVFGPILSIKKYRTKEDV